MFLDKPRDLWRGRNSRLGARTSYARTSDDRKKGEQFKLGESTPVRSFRLPLAAAIRAEVGGLLGLEDGVGVPARIRQSRKIFPSIFPSKRSFPSDRDLARRNQMASPFTLDYATIRLKSERALLVTRACLSGIAVQHI